jgi:hypothetical protein
MRKEPPSLHGWPAGGVSYQARRIPRSAHDNARMETRTAQLIMSTDSQVYELLAPHKVGAHPFAPVPPDEPWLTRTLGRGHREAAGGLQEIHILRAVAAALARLLR